MSRSVLPFCLSAAVFVAGCGASGDATQQDAAKVNGHVISMSTYNSQLLYLRSRTAASQTQIDPCAPTNSSTYTGLCQELKKAALANLVGNELIQEYADKHHLSVSQAEFNTQWNGIIKSQFHDQMPVLAATVKRYHLTVDGYRTQVRQVMLQNKVMFDVTKHLSLYGPALRLARIEVSSTSQLNAVQKDLRRGVSFLRVAYLLSRNKANLCARRQCGDLGWYATALIPPAQGAIALTPVGKVAGPFTGQAGSGLVLVEQRDPHHLLTPSQQSSVRTQLFAKWLSAQKRAASIHQYVTT